MFMKKLTLFLSLLITLFTTAIAAEDPAIMSITFSGWSEIPETMPGHDIEVTGYFTMNPTTAIKEINNEREKVVYDLRGQRIVNPDNIENGLYIINGKVVLIKE